VRGGEIKSPEEFIDGVTQTVWVVDVFYTPDFQTLSLLIITFNLDGGVITGEYKLEHFQALGDEALKDYTMLARLTLATAALEALVYLALFVRRFRLEYKDSVLQSIKLSLSHKCFGYLADLILRCLVITFFVIRLSLVSDGTTRLSEKASAISSIDWASRDKTIECKLPDLIDGIQDLDFMMLSEGAVRTVALVLTLLLFVRFVLFLEVHPRTGMLVTTFKICWDHLIHFVLIFALCNLFLGNIARAIFGHVIPDLVDFNGAMLSLYTGFMTGELYAFISVDWMIFVSVFILIVWGSLLNFFLAIIVEGFMAARKAADDFEGEQSLFYDVFTAVVFEVLRFCSRWPCPSKVIDVLNKLESSEELDTVVFQAAEGAGEHHHVVIASSVFEQHGAAMGFHSEAAARRFLSFHQATHSSVVIHEHKGEAKTIVDDFSSPCSSAEGALAHEFWQHEMAQDAATVADLVTTLQRQMAQSSEDQQKIQRQMAQDAATVADLVTTLQAELQRQRLCRAPGAGTQQHQGDEGAFPEVMMLRQSGVDTNLQI